MIKFGEYEIPEAIAMKMAKTLWESGPVEVEWSSLDKDEQMLFFNEFILPIPQVLKSVGFIPDPSPKLLKKLRAGA